MFPLEHPWAWALGVCSLAALLEGICSGPNVKKRFTELEQRNGSLPLPAWSLIGAGYYLLFFLVLNSLFSRPQMSTWSVLALVIVATILIANAAWNAVFFRAKNLRVTFYLSVAYAAVAGALAVVLFVVDNPLAPWYLFYVGYLGYLLWWSYGLLRLNRPPTAG